MHDTQSSIDEKNEKMSGDISYAGGEMATNDFVDNLKSLSLSQTENAYSTTMKRMIVQLKHAASNGLIDNMPFAMALVDNFHRIIPIFEKKLPETNDSSRQTKVFLEALANSFRDLCLYNLFLEIKESYCLEKIFHRYIPFIKQDYFTNDNKYDHLVNSMLPIIVYSSILISVTEDDLPSDLLSYLLEFTKQNWQSEPRKDVIHNILSLMKVMSKTPALVPMMIRSEWPSTCIQWLKTTGPRPPFKNDFLISLVLQKLARHEIAVQALNQLGCIKALDESKEQMKRDHSEEEYTSINFVQCITYALLVEADELKRNSMLADKLMCQVLEQLVSYVFQASQNRSYFHNGCNITEILVVLSKLFVNDDILTKCLRDSSQLFDCLSQLLIRCASNDEETSRVQRLMKDEALRTLANLLWSISFHPSYHEKFKSNANLMQTLSNLATSSLLYTNTQVKLIPRDIASLKKAAESILWNLKGSHLIRPKEKSDQRSHIMISYSHSDAQFCRELVENLSNHIPVWVDYKQAHHGSNYSDDLWEEIADAMEMATIIVLIVSKEYYDSKSCRQELSYASDTLKKRIVPIYAPNQQFKANGWLGIRIAGQKYVHFGRKDFTNALDELLSLILVDQKSTITTETSRETTPIKTNEQENSIKDWTSKDIRKWFEDNHIHNDLITLFADQFHTGTALLVYAYHLKQFYRNEYVQILANYNKTFHDKRLQTVDFITFADALWRLREKYDPQSRVQTTLETCGENQFSCAMKILSNGMTWL